jgi:hypothetical protein
MWCLILCNELHGLQWFKEIQIMSYKNDFEI